MIKGTILALSKLVTRVMAISRVTDGTHERPYAVSPIDGIDGDVATHADACVIDPWPPAINVFDISVENVADTFTYSEGIDDACIPCQFRSGADCNRCAYFLTSVGRIVAEPESVNVPARKIGRTMPAELPALPASDSARAFVAHLITTYGTKQYTSVELRAAYLAFCAIDGRRPTADNHLRTAMLKLPGVSRESIWQGKKRPIVWIVAYIAVTTPSASATRSDQKAA
jgi:hypothetical protein